MFSWPSDAPHTFSAVALTLSPKWAARLGTVSPILPALRLRPGNRLLVPVIRGQPAASLLSLGDAIAEQCPSRGVVLSLVEIPPKPGGLVTSALVRSRELLRWIAANDYESLARDSSGRLSIHSRFTSDPAMSIREAMLETQCDTILVESPPNNARRRHRLESILRAVSADHRLNLVVARPDPGAGRRGIQPKSVVVPLRGGPNAWLALTVGLALASRFDARLNLLHVYESDQHPGLRGHEAAVFHELVRAASAANPEVLEIDSEATAATLLTIARGHDAVVLGAHTNPVRSGVLVGQMLLPVINGLGKTVILTRAASAESWAA